MSSTDPVPGAEPDPIVGQHIAEPPQTPPMTANKAWVGGLLAALVAGITALIAAREGGVTPDEWWVVIGAAIAGSGLVGGSVYQVRNHPL